LKQVLCRKASATRIPGKDHWHQTAVTTYTENGPFQGFTRKTALFRATQIFQKVTKVVVNSQINVSFSPSPHLTVSFSFKFEILFDIPK
jgi:hypothetical protein